MKILIIIPYFGNFPNYFDFFLKSCKLNSDIEWLIFTDNKQFYDYPNNVKVIYSSFDDIKQTIQNKFDFKISLETPYKLCDYKPAYGYIFSDYIKEYDFWGYCDIDMIFGRIANFINKNLLEEYDKIGHLGHLSLYKNKLDINTMFLKASHGKYRYKEVFTNSRIFVFDEWADININTLLLENNKKIYYEENIIDVYPWDSYFNPIHFDLYNRLWRKDDKNTLIKWENGCIFKIQKLKKGFEKKECLYAHFQKRKLNMDYTILEDNEFYVVPNKIINTSYRINSLYCKSYLKKIINKNSWKYNFHKFKYACIVKTSPLRHIGRKR